MKLNEFSHRYSPGNDFFGFSFWSLMLYKGEPVLLVDKNIFFKDSPHIHENYLLFLNSISEENRNSVDDQLRTLLKSDRKRAQISFKLKKRNSEDSERYFVATVSSATNPKTQVHILHGVFQEISEALLQQDGFQFKEECRSMAYLTHEIRSSLGVILGFAGLGLDEKSKMDKAKCFEIIKRNGANLLKLTTDIAEYSKKNSSEIYISHHDVDVVDILREMAIFFESSCQNKNIHFDIVAPGDLPKTIQSDGVKIRQILINLIGNAIKFTEQGHIFLKVKAHFDAKHSRASVDFVLDDTGSGIPHEKQQLIFNEFEQGGDHVQKKYGGMGLGLSISMKLAKALGGELRLKESSSQGSTFIFTLKDLPYRETCQFQRRHIHH